MKEIINKYRREFVYSVMVFVILQFMLVREVFVSTENYLLISSLGLAAMTLWIASTFFNYSTHRVSRFSDLETKLQLRGRIYHLFVLPIIFYISLAFYLYRLPVHLTVLRQFTIIISVLSLFALFVNIRSTYRKLFKIEKLTHVIYKFLDILIFYFLISGLISYDFGRFIEFLAIVLVGFIMFYHQLNTHHWFDLRSLWIVVLASLILAGAYELFYVFNTITRPLIMTNFLYVIINLGEIYLSGNRKFEDFLTPILFFLMFMMIVMGI